MLPLLTIFLSKTKITNDCQLGTIEDAKFSTMYLPLINWNKNKKLMPQVQIYLSEIGIQRVNK